jgi:hypothetical protein
MFKPISALVLSALVLTSCGTVRDSRFNPVNWFGRSESTPVAVDPNTNPLIPARRASIFRQDRDESYQGRDIAEVTDLVIERRPGGAIIRAIGVATYQGAYDLRLVKVEEESGDGTLTYALRGLQPINPQGSVASRTHSVAVWVTDNDLLGINVIQVKGAGNIRTARR